MTKFYSVINTFSLLNKWVYDISAVKLISGVETKNLSNDPRAVSAFSCF